MEGGFYDTSKLQLSKQRIDRTGYFSEVEVETPPVTGTTDQVDVAVRVKEKPTGTILLGIGFSSADKLILQAGVSQSNIFGSGNTLGAQVNKGSFSRVLSMSFTQPYYTVDGVSRGFDIYNRMIDANVLALGHYTTNALGAGVRFGIPMSEADTIGIGMSAEHTQLGLFSDSPVRLLDFENLYGSEYSFIIGTAGWTRDTRDSVIWTTRGHMQRVSSEVTMPVGDLRYYKVGYEHQWFYPVSQTFTLMLRGDVGIGDGMSGKPLPFFKNYYAGGVTSVRGYNTSSLGPRDLTDNSILGGNRRMVGNAELLFPMPGSGTDRSVRLGAFVDAGQVFAVGEKIALSDLRYAAGLSLAWNSPVGPLRFSVARPLNAKPNDDIQRLQFTLGQVF